MRNYRIRLRRTARFTALLHHIDVPLLIQSFYSLKREAAPGSDGVTSEQYEVELDRRIENLHRRIHTGRSWASPVKRAFIPKADGTMRPLGSSAVEDAIVQHAVVTVFNQVYESDFLGFSYGFRPGRSAHDALDALFVGIVGKKLNWILDADIRGFFDTISHEWLATFIEHRIVDRRMVRLIRKWLKAGVSLQIESSRTPCVISNPFGKGLLIDADSRLADSRPAAEVVWATPPGGVCQAPPVTVITPKYKDEML